MYRLHRNTTLKRYQGFFIQLLCTKSTVLLEIFKSIIFVSALPSVISFGYRKCNKLGTQGWVCISVLATECSIVLKFDWPLITRPLPTHMAIFWVTFVAAIVVWTLWHFYVNRLFWHTEHQLNMKLKHDNNNIEQSRPIPEQNTNTASVSSRKSVKSRKHRMH